MKLSFLVPVEVSSPIPNYNGAGEHGRRITLCVTSVPRDATGLIVNLSHQVSLVATGEMATLPSSVPLVSTGITGLIDNPTQTGSAINARNNNSLPKLITDYFHNVDGNKGLQPTIAKFVDAEPLSTKDSSELRLLTTLRKQMNMHC